MTAKTAAKPAREGVVTLKNVRLSFPHLFEPSRSTEDGPLKYRASFLMDPETEDGAANVEILEKAILKAAKGVWKDKAEKVLKTLKVDRAGLRNGDECTNSEGDVYSGYEGMMAISATNSKKVKVLNRDKSRIDPEDAAVIYAGCYVNAVISIWATDQKKHGGNGVFATLEIVQYARKGEPFGAAELDEDDYLDEMEAEEEDELV